MKLESLNNNLFTPIIKAELKTIKGGDTGYTNTSGKGTVKYGGKELQYNGDVKAPQGKVGYWIPSIVKYVWH